MSEFRKKLRRRQAYLPTLVSITLVLFLSGLFSALLLNAPAIRQYVLENVQMTIDFSDETSEADIMRIREKLSHKPAVKEADYTSKEQQLKDMQEYYGEDLETLGGFNPTRNAIHVFFHSEFVNPKNLEAIKSGIVNEAGVLDVSYDSVLVENLDRHIRTISIVVLSIAILLGLVTVALIFNTIRLTLYARRFLIKSMQLVGATQNFIRMPFLRRGLILGLIGGILAAGMLYAVLRFLASQYPDLTMLLEPQRVAILCAGIILLGILITALASLAAINKYLRMKLDDLF
jgi:cell division transport system permease protein